MPICANNWTTWSPFHISFHKTIVISVVFKFPFVQSAAKPQLANTLCSMLDGTAVFEAWLETVGIDVEVLLW